MSKIEQFINLEKFSFSGQTDLTNRSIISYTVVNSVSQGKYNENMLDYLQNCYDSCQITDISPLYNCKKLISLDLSNQRKITSIDLTNFPKLKKLNLQNCVNLKTINGLSSLNMFQKNSEENIKNEQLYPKPCFDFSGCNVLDDIPDFQNLLAKIKDINVKSILPHMYFPTTTYSHLCRKNSSTQQKLNSLLLENKLEVAKWTEIGPYDMRSECNSKQMSLAKDRIDDIIRTVCKNDDGLDITRISKVYRWICDNVNYDFEGLETSNHESTNKKANNKSDIIRTSFTALFDLSSVCVGISNLFNMFMAELGYSAVPVTCAIGCGLESRASIPDHQISKLFINGNEYYCDPTYDLKSEESECFCLSFNEIKNLKINLEDGLGEYTFPFQEKHMSNSISIQRFLKYAGLLKTQKQDSVIENVQ